MKSSLLASFLASLVAPVAAAGLDVSQLSPLPVDRRAGGDYLLGDPGVAAEAFRTDDDRAIALDNGLIRRTWRLALNGACVAFDQLVSDRSMLRSVRPEASVTVDGEQFDVGGLVGQPNHAYLSEAWLDAMTADPAALRLVGFEVGEPVERFAWKRSRRHAPNALWPPPGVHLRMDYEPGAGGPAIRVSVHYELYDGVPVMSKWLVVHNLGDQAVQLDRFTAETLAVVEAASWVESRDGVDLPRPGYLHVETDFAFGGFNPENANRHVVHWRPDPLYDTQVNYLRETPCLLVVEPTYGPAQTIEPGESFESFRVFELGYDDGDDRERNGLALRRMYRTIAPWTTENPLMHHMRTADPAAVRRAIDQAAEVGFEMVILSFGSGFDIENDDPNYLRAWRETADHAHALGVELGGYSLLSSRRIGGGNDIVSPPGRTPTHGACPALTSEWGQAYFRKLYAFFEATGFDLLEHDGPYPGDVDVTPRPPLQQGEQDSRWAQWRIAADFYKWCRGRGVYLNTPDYYYLVGSNKCGMGYREVNWSLPRAQQVIHTRQNIFDGTWTKTPSMGWMFVPLTQYHGGGAAATIEPLVEHLDHYEKMLASNLGLGVQACYRGPRLYDSAATDDLLRRQVGWYKQYRDLLESDVIHGRRADGRRLDWMLHVNPALEQKGLLVVYNPLDRELRETLKIDLYYTGLKEVAQIGAAGENFERYAVARDDTVEFPATVPAGGMSWYVIQ